MTNKEIYWRVSVCVCVERDRERKRYRDLYKQNNNLVI